MRRSIFIVIGMILIICKSITGFSQETTAEIQGMIADEKGAGLGNATVVATHIPSGTTYTTSTRKDGRYNLANLRIGGPYEIKVTYIGYKEDKQDNVFLVLGQEFQGNFKMTPTATSLTEVVVTTRRGDNIINPNRTGSQFAISRTQIERLPTINRSLQDFTKLTPSSNGLSFGGRNGSFNNLTVDGANFNNAFGLSGTLGGQTSSQPISLDAIDQIQVNIAPYDVRQGGFSGAGINSVTRSGSNQFRGSVYTYIRSADLQGYDAKTVTIPKPTFTYNLRGASVGGPIIENKLFFFLSGEQERQSRPATTLVANKPGQTAVPGVVSQAVADTLDAIKNFLMQKFNYNPGEYQAYNYLTQSDKITARLDWNINQYNTFTVKYNYLKSFSDISPSNSGAIGSRQPSNFGLPFSGVGYRINNNFNILIAEWNTRYKNKFTNKLQAGYSALRDFRSSLASGDFPLVDILNSAGNNTYTSFGYEPFTYNNLLSTDIWQLSDNFTLYKGKHELTFGAQIYVKQFKNGFAPNYEGLYTYKSFTDFYNSVNNGAPTASQYQLQYSLTKDGSFPFALIGVTEVGAYVQDKWRIQPNFTLTYGLRVDAPFFEDKFEFNPYVPDLVFRDGKKYNVGQKPGTNVLISPRVGFNWDVFSNQRTQVRGGVGVFSGAPPFVWVSNQASNNGVQFGSFNILNSGATLNDPRFAFKSDINANRPAAGSVNTSYNLVFTDEDFKYPQVLKSSLGIDQKLPGDFIVSVDFSYSKDLNAVYFQNVNLPSTGTALAGSDNRIRYSGTRIYSGAGGATVTNPNITNAILMTNSNEGYSYFLTAQVQKTFKNLYMSVAYTNSKSKSLNDGGSIAASMWRDRPVKGDPNAEDLGYSNFYQPHRVIATASYRFEYGKNFATSIGLVYEAAPSPTSTTLPVTVAGSYTYSGDINNDGTGGNNDLIYIPKDQSDIILVPINTGGGTITDNRTPAQIWGQLNNFINQDAYMSKHRGQVAERNAVVLPYWKHLDLNITQDFYLKSGKNGKDKHTLRVSFDIINFGNFINKNWGVAKTFAPSFNTSQNAASFLKYEGLVPAGSPDAGKPRYSFLYQDEANRIPFTSSFIDNPSAYFSRWQGQIGIRYLFN